MTIRTCDEINWTKKSTQKTAKINARKELTTNPNRIFPYLKLKKKVAYCI